MPRNGFKLRKKNLVNIILIAIFITTLILSREKFLYRTSAHSPEAYPMEIFSLWNDTAPTIDGKIEFTAFELSGEWSSAAVYNMYDIFNNAKSKLLLQNDNTNAYIGIDCTHLTVEYPVTDWGINVLLDLDHNGWLSNADYWIKYSFSSGVILHGYSQILSSWQVLESGTLGTPLPVSGILVDSDYARSAFNNITSHRQYEIVVPYGTPINDKTIGAFFEASPNLASNSDSITWPYRRTGTKFVEIEPETWGDAHLCDQSYFEEYIIEDTFYVNDGAVGEDNNTVLMTADINGDGDQELVVTSNRQVTGEENIISIFDYIGGEITRIWCSLDSAHYGSLFHITGMEAYDFDEDGVDELYGVGFSDSRIGRLMGWNNITKDFDTAEIIFDNFGDFLMGYIAIGDASNYDDGTKQIAFGDSTGVIGILDYDDKKDEFDLLGYVTPFPIGGINPYRVHAIDIEDMDSDGWIETIFFSQNTSDNAISDTLLQIIEIDDTSYYDNPTDMGIFHEDDLQSGSHNNTFDHFGHTIIIEDVDNDGEIETTIVGKDFIKIFGQHNFNDSQVPLEFTLNDGINPDYAGGAGVFDIDGDTFNELVFGCSNGTIVILEITNNDPDPYEKDLVYTEEWRADIGSAPGIKNSILGYDIDEDGDMEIILGDHTGQIMVIGLGNRPSVSFTSPSYGYVSNQETLLLEWLPSNESNPMDTYQVWVNGMFQIQTAGGQLGAYISLDLGSNDIFLYAWDVLGFITIENIYVEYTQGAPEVTITAPENYHLTKDDTVMVHFFGLDPDMDPITYDIYRNGTQVAFDLPGTTTQYSVDLKISGIPIDGYYNITVVADDGNGNLGKDSIFVIRDTEGPDIEILSPADGTAVNVDYLEVWWTAFDELAGVEYFNVYLDEVYQGYTYDYYYGVDLPSDKTYTIRIEAFDYLLNSQSHSIEVIRDTFEPSIELPALSLPMIDDWYYTDNPIQFIGWSGEDNVGGSGIYGYEVYIDAVYMGFYDKFTLNDTFDLGGEGFKFVQVIIWDNAYNYAFDYHVIAVDSSNPTIDITSPYDGYVTSDESVVVTWTSDDLGTGIASHVIYVNGTYEATVDKDEFFYTYDIGNNETYTITVRAYDYLLQYTEESIDVTHNSFAPTFSITTPYEFSSYADDTIINVEWGVQNIVPDEFQVFVNGTFYGTYTSSTFDADIDFESVFGLIEESDYPLANVTVSCYIGGTHAYTDMRWITIDQLAPSVAILDPSNSSIIISSNLYVEWSAYDAGSGIAGYNVWLNGDFIGTYGSGTTSQFIDVSGYADGWHDLVVETFDVAGNTANKTIQIELYPQAPEFSINLDSLIITNDPNFDLNISIYDPRLGVSEVQVLADGATVVYYNDFGGMVQYDPFWIDMAIADDVFVALGDFHNLTITVYDAIDRGRIAAVNIIADYIAPDVFQDPILGGSLLYPTTNILELSDTPSENIFNLTIIAQDTYGIGSIYVNIEGDGFNETYDMIFDPSGSASDIYKFYYLLNFSDIETGNYTLTFLIFDNAGNAASSDYDLTIQAAEAPPGTNQFLQWIMDNLYTIVIPAGAGILLAILLPIILVAATKKRRLNKGWQEALEAVAYVTKTGLTLAYVPYSKDLFEDEQLFGGAMTGIMSILGEITGQTDVEMQVHVLEFGDKRLLVCPGYFGNGILLVNDEKPILKELLPKFLMDFELTYKTQLASDLIDLNEFQAVPLLVESIFGFRKEFYQQYSEQQIETFYESTDGNYQQVDQQTDQQLSDQQSSQDYYQEF
ncbi:MAG: hypothetical protein FK733_01515 [Asgard group archaeon]|nr:hypothetical protein [Asgard group archaeon]